MGGGGLSAEFVEAVSNGVVGSGMNVRNARIFKTNLVNRLRTRRCRQVWQEIH